MLLLSGISSVFERIILAVTQQRQSPSNISLFGFLNFAIDGVKLFSKVPPESFTRNLNGFLISTFMTTAFLTASVFHRNELTEISSTHVVNALGLLEILELSVFIYAQNQGNHFIDIAFARLFELTVLAELTFSLISIAILLTSARITDVEGGNGLLPGIFLFIFTVSIFMLQNQRVPFDLVEAESEVIDGISADLSGFLFSTFYATEIIAFLLTTKLYISGVNTIITVFIYSILISAGFIGRIFMARFLIRDTIELSFSYGLVLCSLSIILVC